MSAKIIPFGIIVNAKRNSTRLRWDADNLPMESQTIEKTLEELARERGMVNVFKPDGRLNQRELAAELTRRCKQQGGKKPINQPFLNKLIKGKSVGKESTLKPMALGFGMSVNELIAKLRPETTAAPVVSLPPAARELWELFQQLPRQLQNFFIEQMKTAIANKNQSPELWSAITSQAQKAANEIRVERHRKRTTGS